MRDVIYSFLRGSTEPVTSVVPTQDNQTYLVTSLDSHIRLMDMSSGRLLNDFTGHVNTAYRCRGCFGHAEATVVCGDENGMIWAWDLMDVSHNGTETSVLPSSIIIGQSTTSGSAYKSSS